MSGCPSFKELISRRRLKAKMARAASNTRMKTMFFVVIDDHFLVPLPEKGIVL